MALVHEIRGVPGTVQLELEVGEIGGAALVDRLYRVGEGELHPEPDRAPRRSDRGVYRRVGTDTQLIYADRGILEGELNVLQPRSNTPPQCERRELRRTLRHGARCADETRKE